MILSKVFYTLKPALPRRFQIFLRRQIATYKRKKYHDVWPIDPSADNPPLKWKGWPDKKKFALVLTHDVDSAVGHKKCRHLAKLEKNLGFRSSFNFVPERYSISPTLRRYLADNGFEVGVHGLKHDGKLYRSRKIFQRRSLRINRYLKQWGSVGFRSPAMHHNLDWIFSLNIEYDMSTFDTDPYEPQSDGVGTIFPFLVRDMSTQNEYVELPYTLCQDFTLFIILQEKGIDLWKEKIDWIMKKGGMALLNTHPDYMSFNAKPQGIEEYPVEYYIEFLNYIQDVYEGKYWNSIPMNVAKFWKTSTSLLSG